MDLLGNVLAWAGGQMQGPGASAKTDKPPVSTSVPSQKSAVTASGSGSSGATSLDDIKQLIEAQTKIMASQNDKITLLASEVEALKRKLGSGSQDQSERIRQLELELEEARS